MPLAFIIDPSNRILVANYNARGPEQGKDEWVFPTTIRTTECRDVLGKVFGDNPHPTVRHSLIGQDSTAIIGHYRSKRPASEVEPIKKFAFVPLQELPDGMRPRAARAIAHWLEKADSDTARKTG